MQYILIFLAWLVILWTSYLTFRSAAKAILNGNVSKSNYKKILKKANWKSRISMDYITPYAKLYSKQLKIIILLSKIYLGLFVSEFFIGLALLFYKTPLELWIILIVFNFCLALPVYVYEFIASYPGWGKKQRRGWKYEIDGKNKRKQK